MYHPKINKFYLNKQTKQMSTKPKITQNINLVPELDFVMKICYHLLAKNNKVKRSSQYG